MELFFNAAGGLALFLLAMVMMTDGLRIYVGGRLKQYLQNWTTPPAMGVVSGALVTALVQSSSAVTVATIGFVNAGILNLRQALGVIFGANIGTTITGWLVSLIGFGFKIDELAMPLLALGVLLRFASSSKKYRSLGESIIGFGLFFLGLAILQEAFASVAEGFGTQLLTRSDLGGLPSFVLAGFVLTLLTQSSSAAIAIILIGVSQSVFGFHAAAAAIIGANVGTTSTAALAALKATSNARRVAMGHITFNLITGIIALLILPALIQITELAGNWFGNGENKLPALALFHTIFNFLGVILLVPFIDPMAKYLKEFFKTEEEDLAHPKFLDKSLTGTPAIALSAITDELTRLKTQVCALALATLHAHDKKPRSFNKKAEAVVSLAAAIHHFSTQVHMGDMSQDIAERMPDLIRITRYLEEANRILIEVNDLIEETPHIKDSKTKQPIDSLQDEAEGLIKLIEETITNEGHMAHHDAVVIALDKFETCYQEAKASMLRAAASHKLSPEEADTILDQLSRLRRMVEQVTKADLMLQNHAVTETQNISD